MDFDFSLVLSVLVLFTGIVTALDKWFFGPRRQKSVESYKKQTGTAARNDVIDGLMAEPAWIEYPKSFFSVLLIVFVLRSFLVEPFTIPSGSMIPTLLEGDYILVNKFAYGLRVPVLGYKFLNLGEPKRGDVMVFRYPQNPRVNYIKRVVGLPGDSVRYENKKLYINDQEMPQQKFESDPGEDINIETLGLVAHRVRLDPSRNRYQHSENWVIPEGSYFMMGDNRDNSNDSRFWGMVPEENIVGKAFAIWMHWRGFTTLPNFSRNGSIH